MIRLGGEQHGGSEILRAITGFPTIDEKDANPEEALEDSDKEKR